MKDMMKKVSFKKRKTRRGHCLIYVSNALSYVSKRSFQLNLQRQNSNSIRFLFKISSNSYGKQNSKYKKFFDVDY